MNYTISQKVVQFGQTEKKELSRTFYLLQEKREKKKRKKERRKKERRKEKGRKEEEKKREG